MRPLRARGVQSAFAAAAALLCLVLPAFAAAAVTVFAAASLKESLDSVAQAWQASGGEPVRVAYGASSALARQIAAGAPAEVFISADLDWMRYVESRGLVRGQPVKLLANDLVLIAPAGSAVKLRIEPGFDLARALAGGRLAIADPRAVPAGKYGRAALESLGAWNAVADHLAPAGDVRTALAMVARGEAPLGIVYSTDARAEPRVRVVGAFPAGSHPPIVYPLAELRTATAAGQRFAQFAASPAARAIWSRFGFGTP